MTRSTTLLQDLVAEVEEFTMEDLHPKVEGLISAFLTYLKEPRYQNPLTLSELRKLFDAFHEDLYSLIFHIYTQSNTNKRKLLQDSYVFKLDPVTFDYLGAIANYSSSSVKLSKRSDPDALYQLRVFAFYKFLTITKMIELALSRLYSSVSTPDTSTLYEKVFRFDSRDIELSHLLSRKIRLLRPLNLPIDCYLEVENLKESSNLRKALQSLEFPDNPRLAEIQAAFTSLSEAQTPLSKLCHIAEIQKIIIRLCASFQEKDCAQISNDVLLPAFIFIFINHSPINTDDDSFDLYLQFSFVKNFWKSLDPHSINTSRFTLNSSFISYNPVDKRTILPKNNQTKTLASLLNMDSGPATETQSPTDGRCEPQFTSDASLMSYINSKYLNSGELQFCLTNCEAILFFLMSTPIVGIAGSNFDYPPDCLDSDLVNLSLLDIVDKTKDVSRVEDSKTQQKLLEEEFADAGRSRSSSLFNTITSAVSQSVNRSRSNSGVKLESPSNKESSSNAMDFETSLKAYPGANETYGLSRVRNIFERIGSASHLQLRPHESDNEVKQENADIPETPETNRVKRSQSLLGKLSPGATRNRSASFEWNSQGPSLRRSTLTSKFSSGMNELMTKISSAANTATGSSTNVASMGASLQAAHASSSSVHSIEDPFDDATFASRGALSNRSSSLQTMEKWFCNIPENTVETNVVCHRSNRSDSSNRYNPSDSNYNEGSVFSASFGELTKYHFTDFDSMTISDLKNLKVYYDQLCSEVLSGKTGSKTSNEFLPEDGKDVTSNVSSLEAEKHK